MPDQEERESAIIKRVFDGLPEPSPAVKALASTGAQRVATELRRRRAPVPGSGGRNHWYMQVCSKHGDTEHLSMFLPGNACVKCRQEREKEKNDE